MKCLVLFVMLFLSYSIQSNDVNFLMKTMSTQTVTFITIIRILSYCVLFVILKCVLKEEKEKAYENS